MKPLTHSSTRPAVKWTARLIPVFLGVCVCYASYIVPRRVCWIHFRLVQEQAQVASVFLALYIVFAAAMVASYLRLLRYVFWNPDVLPLGPGAVQARYRAQQNRQRRAQMPSGIVEAIPYDPSPDSDPDSPGLELFYTKDVFVCETDGRPRWCSSCCNWKPDRTYHNHETDRCFKKLDHFCPWVGGIISQSSYKFFIQFNWYATLYCTVVLASCGMTTRDQATHGAGLDGHVVAGLAMGGFFGFFALCMTLTSTRFVLSNMTNVEAIKKGRGFAWQLALRVPSTTTPGLNYGTVVYPLPKPGLRHANTGSTSQSAASLQPLSRPRDELYPSARDLLATRTFAVARSQVADNPWDLGWWQNWKSVMGNNPLDWLLPWSRSPCCFSENFESFYAMRPSMHQLRTRYGLRDPSETRATTESEGGTEMREMGLFYNAVEL